MVKLFILLLSSYTIILNKIDNTIFIIKLMNNNEKKLF